MKDPIDLKPLFNGEISDIHYVLEAGNSVWHYDYQYEYVWSINTYESIFISKIMPSKLSGTINISIVD